MVEIVKKRASEKYCCCAWKLSSFFNVAGSCICIVCGNTSAWKVLEKIIGKSIIIMRKNV